ncbi:MAG: hypothetical protein ABII01_03455 [Candidatus Woesearchaeota archaeon]
MRKMTYPDKLLNAAQKYMRNRQVKDHNIFFLKNLDDGFEFLKWTDEDFQIGTKRWDKTEYPEEIKDPLKHILSKGTLFIFEDDHIKLHFSERILEGFEAKDHEWDSLNEDNKKKYDVLLIK